jgi:hypothetical protein
MEASGMNTETTLRTSATNANAPAQSATDAARRPFALPPIVTDALAILCRPRIERPDSFGLHAQLEVMARIGLLQWLDPAEHRTAFDRISAVAAKYETEGELVDSGDVAPTQDFPTSVERATQITLSLAAAGHAPIGFHLADRLAAWSLPANLLIPPLHEVDRFPDLRIEWHRSLAPTENSDVIGNSTGADVPDDDRTSDSASALDSFHRALRAARFIGPADNEFILPLMRHFEASGEPDATIAAFLPWTSDLEWYRGASRLLARMAAWSMLHDDDAVAPYGWTHCLTMPQGALSMVNHGVSPRDAFVAGTTFALGIRGAFGREPLGALDDHAAVDAAADPRDGRPTRSRHELATWASNHEDAHLVKYTLACFHAADDDPHWEPVYMAAATALADWWMEHPGHAFG